MNNTRLVILIGVTSLAALLEGLAGEAIGLGLAAVLLTSLLVCLGLRTVGRIPLRTRIAIAIFYLSFSCLIVLAQALHDPAGPLILIGGFPAGLSMLVYGMIPIGVGLGLLYAVIFDHEILPEERLNRFLTRNSRK